MPIQEQLIKDIKQLPESVVVALSAIVKEFLKNGHQKQQKNPREAMFGCMRGQYKIASDFDAPLEDFREYME